MSVMDESRFALMLSRFRGLWAELAAYAARHPEARAALAGITVPPLEQEES